MQQATLHSSVLHTLDGYNWDVEYGDGGGWLKELIEWYDFETHSAGFKATNGRDTILSGLASALLLLRWAYAALGGPPCCCRFICAGPPNIGGPSIEVHLASSTAHRRRRLEKKRLRRRRPLEQGRNHGGNKLLRRGP